MEATTFLHNTFPGVEVKFDDDFEGMEKLVVVNITNGSIGNSPSIIPLSLTRANNHLVIFSEDFREIFQNAVEQNLMKRSKYDLSPTAQSDEDAVGTLSTGLKEASRVLASLARRMPLESVAALAEEWGVRDLYGQLVVQETTRGRMVEALAQKHFADNPTITLAQFVESLEGVNMSDAVAEKIKANLEYASKDMKERIEAKNLTDEEQVSLAHSLGQRNLFNSLTRPEDPVAQAVPDREALVMCLDTWTTNTTTSEHLIECLLKAGLTQITADISEKLANNCAADDIASFKNMTLREKIGASAFDVFLPIAAMILTAVYMACIYSESDNTYFNILLFINWIPSTPFFSIHLYFNQDIFGPIISKLFMVVLLVAQPASGTVLQVNYLMRRIRFTGQAVETFKMKKFLQLAQSSTLMNNFTSLCILVLTLHLANTGHFDTPATITISTTTAALHLVQLGRNVIKQQIREEETDDVAIKLFMTTFPVASSLLLKTLFIVFLLSSKTAYSAPLACFTVLFVLGLNLFLERKMCGATDGSSWLRAAHSLIFPLAPRTQGRRAALGAALQLLVGNLCALAVGSTVALTTGVTDNIFITTNIVKATTAMSVLLVLHMMSTYAAVFVLPATSTTQSLTEDDVEEGDNVSTESTPLMPSQHAVQGGKWIKSTAWVLVLPISLGLLLASPYLLLLHQFNTCPALSPFLPDSRITCTNHSSTLPTVGTVCSLSCSPLHWSSSSLETACTWRGAWTVAPFTCRPQVVTVTGRDPLRAGTESGY
jgi:hypothetical protein